MRSSNLYRIHPEAKTLQSVREVNFSDHSLRERYDIQEWVEETPSILGERLLIVAKEKSHFDGTNERPDLVAIDEDGNIVVIELKRDDSGADVYWQAIKYASYWSRFSVQDVLRVYADYLTKHRQDEGGEEVDEEYAKQEIVDFINQDTVENVNKRQRVILVSHRFAREAISAVDWLLENYGLDIRCIELIPYFDEDKATFYLQSNMILPVAGVDEYLITPSSAKAAAAKGSRGSRNDDEVTQFFERLRDALVAGNNLDASARPTCFSRWAGSDHKFRYYHFWYRDGLWDNWQESYRVWLYNHLETNGHYQNRVRTFLHVQRKHLLQNGVTEKKADALTQTMRAVCEESSDFNFVQKDDSFAVEAVLPFRGLDDALHKKLQQTLTALISITYTSVASAMSSEATNAT